MRIFVTGGTGYIGSAFCRRMIGAGHRLRALVRATSDTSQLEKMGAETFVGDITDRYSMREAMSGADWVVHAAAELDFGAPTDLIEGANVTGSDNVASLAYRLGVGRVLALSSIAAFGGSPPDGTAVDETAGLELPFPSAYSATKRAGEETFAAWAQRGLKLNVIYPSLVYGPPGSKGGLNVAFRAIARRRLPAIVGADRLTRWVYLEDLVAGMEAVIERTEPGENFMMTGDLAVLGDVFEQAAALAGVAPPRKVSVGWAKFLGRILAPVFRVRGRVPPIKMSHLESLRRHWNFDDSKAQRELGWCSRSLEDGLRETISYLREH